METSYNPLQLHPQFLEFLFVFKSKVSHIFREVLGIHEVDHIAITRIDKRSQLLTFSSTPALEFNLFNSPLWRHDKSYDPLWFHKGSQAYWQSLYDPSRYDELYYIKQIKHTYPLGLSLAAKIDNEHYIYSLASHKACAVTKEVFATQQDDFYKIGQYCTKMLIPFFNNEAHLKSNIFSKQVAYEISK